MMARSATAVLLVLCAVQCGLVIVVEYPPLQDYPNHLMVNHVRSHVAEVPVYRENVVVEENFQLAILLDLMLRLGQRVIPVQDAGRLSLIVIILTSYVSVFFFLRRFGGGIVGALIAGHVIGGWVFLKGLLNFHLACGIGLLYLALLFPRDERLKPRRVGLLMCIATLVTVAHPFAFMVIAVIAGISVVILRWGRWRSIALALSTLVPAGLVLVVFLYGRESTLTQSRFLYDITWKQFLFWIPLEPWSRFDWRLDRLTGAIAYLAIGLGLVSFLTGRSRAEDRDGLRLTVFLGLALALYVLMPDRLGEEWGHMKGRVAYLLILCTAPLADRVRVRPLQSVIVVALLATTALSTWSTARRYLEISRQTELFVRLADELPESRFLMVLDMTQPDVGRRNLHSWAYVCMRRDCLTGELFAKRRERNVVFRREPPPEPFTATARQHPAEVWAAVTAGGHDGVLIRGRLAEVEAELESHMDLVSRNEAGSLFLTR